MVKKKSKFWVVPRTATEGTFSNGDTGSGDNLLWRDFLSLPFVAMKQETKGNVPNRTPMGKMPDRQ